MCRRHTDESATTGDGGLAEYLRVAARHQHGRVGHLRGLLRIAPTDGPARWLVRVRHAQRAPQSRRGAARNASSSGAGGIGALITTRSTDGARQVTEMVTSMRSALEQGAPWRRCVIDSGAPMAGVRPWAAESDLPESIFEASEQRGPESPPELEDATVDYAHLDVGRTAGAKKTQTHDPSTPTAAPSVTHAPANDTRPKVPSPEPPPTPTPRFLPSSRNEPASLPQLDLLHQRLPRQTRPPPLTPTTPPPPGSVKT